MSLGIIKQLSISIGLYRPARAIHRLLTDQTDRQDQRNLLSHLIKPGDLVFDVGANIGERTDIMLSLGARVVAFEPQPILAREVRERGKKHAPLTVVQAAVGTEVGTANLLLTGSTGMASLRPDWDPSIVLGELPVLVTTLDIEIEKYGVPAFCKIDVEGLEVDVLNGLSAPIQALSFEYHCNEIAVERVKLCVARLMDLGTYEFNLTGTECGKWLSPDWMPHDVFLNAFPRCAHPHFYGDVFARIVRGSNKQVAHQLEP